LVLCTVTSLVVSAIQMALKILFEVSLKYSMKNKPSVLISMSTVL
jgi:hypothetical protein